MVTLGVGNEKTGGNIEKKVPEEDVESKGKVNTICGRVEGEKCAK